MRKIFTIVGIIATATVANAQNLLTNPGFESGLAPWKAGTGSGYTEPVNSTDAHTGSGSVTYINATSTTGFYQNVPVTGGETYVISFWYKSTGNARIWSIYNDSSKKAVYTTDNPDADQFRTNNKYLPKATEWTQVTVEMPAPPTATSLDVAFRVYKEVTASFDDIMVYKKGTFATLNLSTSKYSLVTNTVAEDKLSFGKRSEVKIFSANGQLVKTASVDNGTELNISALAKGLYIVTGEVDGQKVSQKIIKK